METPVNRYMALVEKYFEDENTDKKVRKCDIYKIINDISQCFS